jgi:hypothetical protein
MVLLMATAFGENVPKYGAKVEAKTLQQNISRNVGVTEEHLLCQLLYAGAFMYYEDENFKRRITIWRHITCHNDTCHEDTSHKVTHHNVIHINDTHINTHNNDIHNNDTHHNDTSQWHSS